jgi:predicted TIM-barrel fold metal-dependent hydrolase
MGDSLRFIDSDGHVVETGRMVQEMADHAPKGWRERIMEVRGGGATARAAEYHEPSPDDAAPDRLMNPMMRPGGHQAGPRVQDMDAEGIDVSVLYPTFLLGVQGLADVDLAEAQCQAYNNWLSDHVAETPGRLWGAAVVPQQDLERAAREIRRAAELPGIRAAFIRPNPTADWKPFSHPVYHPIWQAASDSGMPLGLHPFLAPDLPGACQAFRLGEVSATTTEATGVSGDNNVTVALGNIFFTQAIANPFDMMNSLTFILAGGVCERFPDLKLVFLEANGGWIVPWLERLDHHYEVFDWDVPTLKMPPSGYFRRQCWISFDTDESTLALTANSPLVGADRIVWASDYPHPDAKIPGVTKELEESISSLSREQQALIAGGSAVALYDL